MIVGSYNLEVKNNFPNHLEVKITFGTEQFES